MRHSCSKHICAFFLALLVALATFGQDVNYQDDPNEGDLVKSPLSIIENSKFELGIKNGINTSSLIFSPQPQTDRLSLSPGTGFSLQLVGKYGSNTGTAYQFEPGYIRKSSKMSQTLDTTTQTWNIGLNYLTLPFYMKYQANFNHLFGSVFQQFYIQGGAALNILMDASLKVEFSDVSNSVIVNDLDGFSDSEFPMLIGAGSRFVVGPTSSIYIEAKFHQSLNDINREFINRAAGIEIIQSGFQVLVGFSVHFPKQGSLPVPSK